MWNARRMLGFVSLGCLCLTQISAWQGTAVTVCASGCTTASLQAAFDSVAKCGDTIRIREPQSGNFRFSERGCGSNPITVTTDRMEWLPAEGTRITPSHLANMAVLSTPNTEPVLMGMLDSGGRPPAGWIFIGIAFTKAQTGVTYALVDLAGFGYQPQSDAETPNNITFDRCYFWGSVPGPKSTSIQNVLRANGRNIVVKNSFFGDAAWPGVESHGIFMLEAPGPVTIENNFVTTSSIPIFSGGAVPNYPVVPANIKVRYNYTFRPWKWNRDPAQPFAADYVANSENNIRSNVVQIADVSSSGVVKISPGQSFPPTPGSLIEILGVTGCLEANRVSWRGKSVDATSFQLVDFPGCSAAYQGGGTASDHSYQVCLKNHGELKFADTVLWQYNVGENSWKQSDCQSQRTGFTNTTRTSWDLLTGVKMNSVSELNWTGAYKIGGPSSCCGNFTKDLGVCVSLPAVGTECRPVATFDNNQNSITVTTPFSTVFRDGPVKTWLSYTGSARLTNVTLANNVWRNVSQGLSVLANSFSNGVGDAGYGKNHMIANNLWWNSNTYVESQLFWGAMAGEADYVDEPTDYTFAHNTFYSVTPLTQAFAYFSASGCRDCGTQRQPKFNGLNWSNNLMGPSAAIPFFGDSWIGIKDAVADFYLANSKVQNNGIPGVRDPNGCGGTNTCSGNIATAWSDPFMSSPRGILKVVPGNRYAGAASDGTDIGADFDQLPLIQNLQVTAGLRSAVLEFDLSAPIADAAATQPCVLEVSTTRNLHSDLGKYTVIPDLDPALFRRPDSSARNNEKLAPVLITGKHVSWPVGTEDPTPVVADDGSTQDLRLASGKTYYGRLMCYGDTQFFTFNTERVVRRRSLQFKVATTPEVTAVRVRYGSHPKALEGVTEFPIGPGGETNLQIPLGDVPTLYQVEFAAGSKTVYKGKMEHHE